MTEAHMCAECGADLPANAPEGLCPRCLLQGGLPTETPVPVPVNTTGPGTAFTAPTPAELAALFPHLEILDLLGQGGMGAVYKARQVKLDRMVAVKVLPPEWGRDPAFAERFAREARALARLNHPQIVAVHDFGEAGGLFFLIMEYVDGVNLRQLLQSGKLPQEKALQIIPQVCDALQYAHEEGIVHRDIKPENILLDKKGRVKIADFGLAKLLDHPRATYTLTGSRQVMGTVHYMAPEQIERPQQVDHRADIFSLGVVFYEMLTGELPLGRFAPPSERALVDRRVDDVVFRALEREPERRYQRISQVKNAVEAIRLKAPRLVEVAVETPDEAVPVVGLDAEMVQLEVKGPAAALFVTGIAAFCFVTAIAIALIVNNAKRGRGPFDGRPEVDWPLFLLGAAVVYGLVGVIFAGARALAQLRNYELALMAIILASLPTGPHVLIGLPAGAWAHSLLKTRRVREGFMRNARRRRGNAVDPNQEMAELEVKEAVVGLRVTGIVAFCFVTGLAIGLIVNNSTHKYGREGPFSGPPELDWPLFIVGLLLIYGLIGVIFAGASALARVRRYELVMVAIILAMLPLGPQVFVGFFAGIWALTSLKKPEVRRAFVHNLKSGSPDWPEPLADDVADAPAPAEPSRPVRGRLGSFWRSVRTMFFSSPDKEGR